MYVQSRVAYKILFNFLDFHPYFINNLVLKLGVGKSQYFAIICLTVRIDSPTCQLCLGKAELYSAMQED